MRLIDTKMHAFVTQTLALASCLFQQSVHALVARTSQPYHDLGRNFDYIIVGAGPGGLTVANRLTEDPSVSVAVVEAGQYYEDVVGNWSTVPGHDYHYDGKSPEAKIPFVDWDFVTVPQAGIDGERIHYVRGKTLGGSTGLNYMSYTHSSVGAYQMWVDKLGDESWSYKNLQKFAKKSMNFSPPRSDSRLANATPSYDPDNTATGGPLHVSYPNYAQSWSTWAAKGLEAIGIPHQNSFIDGKLLGSAWMMHTIDSKTGLRASAEYSYLRPFLTRPNLAVFNGTLAERIVFDKYKAAKGVKVTTAGNTYILNARRETIVAGGVFQSPQLLQVSGIGPKAVLKQHNIHVIADRPGVGANLVDHVFFGIGYRVNIETASALAYGNAMDIATEQFKANATGPLSSPGGDYVGLEKVPEKLRSQFSPETIKSLGKLPDDYPELQYLVLPNYAGDVTSPEEHAPLDGSQYATLVCVLIAPESRGNVSISSRHMKDQPVINPNWLTAKSDIEVTIAGFKRLREALTSEPMRHVTVGEEFYPGPSVQTDDEIYRQIKKSFSPMYHAASSNKMGKPDDDMAVLDSEGRVYEVSNLRVVDASAFPFLPPGPSPQVAVYMVAEKLAEDIKTAKSSAPKFVSQP